jgi:hypothetical protein
MFALHQKLLFCLFCHSLGQAITQVFSDPVWKNILKLEFERVDPPILVSDFNTLHNTYNDIISNFFECTRCLRMYASEKSLLNHWNSEKHGKTPTQQRFDLVAGNLTTSIEHGNSFTSHRYLIRVIRVIRVTHFVCSPLVTSHLAAQGSDLLPRK